MRRSEPKNAEITAVDNFQTIVPTWMFNHQKDVTTGQDIHILGLN